jgi:hypothetical protein
MCQSRNKFDSQVDIFDFCSLLFVMSWSYRLVQIYNTVSVVEEHDIVLKTRTLM